MECFNGVLLTSSRFIINVSFQGCDGSVLLNSTATNQAEREAHVNFGLRGVAEIDEIKAGLEHFCPGVVSCADILILAARDATAKVSLLTLNFCPSSSQLTDNIGVCIHIFVSHLLINLIPSLTNVSGSVALTGWRPNLDSRVGTQRWSELHSLDG